MRTLRVPFFLLVAASSAGFGALAAPPSPVISRVSSAGAAAPNDTIIISGAGLAGAVARLCPLRGTAPCLSLPGQPSSWDGGLHVTLPANESAIGAFSVSACLPTTGACSNATQAQRYVVNAPRVHWLLGEGAIVDNAVVVGGVLRLFGSSLALDPSTGVCAPIVASTDVIAPGALAPAWDPSLAIGLTHAPASTATTVYLCMADLPCTALPAPILASCHRIDVRVPASTPTGAYFVRVDNGLATSVDGLSALEAEPALTVVAPLAPPNPKVYVVGTDCSIADCLATAAAGGGGTVLLPAGVWDVPANTPLTASATTALVGEGAAASVLRWAANSAQNAPAAALTCSGGGVTVANLTLLMTSPIQDGLLFAGTGCFGEGLNGAYARPRVQCVCTHAQKRAQHVRACAHVRMSI